MGTHVKANASTLSKRHKLAGLAGEHFGGERDLYEVLGYPKDVAVETFYGMYERQDIASRIIDAYPDATWREAPDLVGDDAPRREIERLQERLGLWRIFHRLDRLTGLGHYGILLLGLDGGEPLSQPAANKDYNLLFLQPHSERTAQVRTWETDPTSPRYGRPRDYTVQIGANHFGSTAGEGGSRSLTVHHSRVIHVAERPLEDAAIGVPRLMPVLNRLMDLDKLLGGSAEIYWQNAAMMLAFVADSGVEWQPDEQADMKDQLEEMQHGLRRMLRLRGVEAQNLAPGLQGATPGDHVDKQLDMIAGTSGIPKRILTGSEAGHLASSQDENAFASRVTERRQQFANPSIIAEFVRKGQRLGFLPDGELVAEWQEADTLGEEKRAAIADQKAAALQKYMQAIPMGVEDVVPVSEFRREYLGLEDAPDADDVPSLEDDLPEDPEARE